VDSKLHGSCCCYTGRTVYASRDHCGILIIEVSVQCKQKTLLGMGSLKIRYSMEPQGSHLSMEAGFLYVEASKQVALPQP
jgi:hypothetical protein